MGEVRRTGRPAGGVDVRQRRWLPALDTVRFRRQPVCPRWLTPGIVANTLTARAKVRGTWGSAGAGVCSAGGEGRAGVDGGIQAPSIDYRMMTHLQ